MYRPVECIKHFGTKINCMNNKGMGQHDVTVGMFTFTASVTVGTNCLHCDQTVFAADNSPSATGKHQFTLRHANSAIMIIAELNEVKSKIQELDKRFNKLKKKIRECLEKGRHSVEEVADALTSHLPDVDDHHRNFLESRVRALFGAKDNSELFGTMNFQWNYLDPGLLDHLVRKFELKEVKAEMDTYMSDLEQFRMKTPLTLFSKTQRKKHIEIPPDFSKITARFDLTNQATLEDVEKFRKEYASHYKVHEFFMMIAQICCGSIIITWVIPESLVTRFKKEMPIAILKKYSVTQLEIGGECVYHKEVIQQSIHCVSIIIFFQQKTQNVLSTRCEGEPFT